jgi:hypothetical protein
MENITMQREFNSPFDTLEWVDAPGMPKGCRQAILYRDPEQGTYLRMLRVEPGVDGGASPMVHDFDETVFIYAGGLVMTG